MEKGVAKEKPLFQEFWEHEGYSYQLALPHKYVDNLMFCTVTGQWHPQNKPKLYCLYTRILLA